MWQLLKWYRWVDILSLDVAAGAVICAYYFSTISSVELSPIVLSILGLSVWIIYTADHLKDASRIKNEATTLRHKFHQQHFKFLFISIIIAGMVILILVLNLDKHTVLWGLKLSVIVLLYLATNHYLSYTKEIVGGLLYCVGVLLPTFSQLDSPWILLGRYEVVIFGLLVFINLFLFSAYELDEDKQDDHKSFAQRFGKSITVIIVKTMLSIVSIILLISWGHIGFQSRIIFSLMILVLLAVTILPKTFERNDLYRYWGDLIFLFPALAFMA